MSLFDNLKSQIEKQKKNEGIRPTDLLTLAPPLRRVMKLLLREVQMAYPDICEAIEKLPASQALTRETLDNALSELTESGWLIRMGQDKLITYKANLRYKPASKLQHGMWGALDKQLKQRKDKDATKGG